MTAAAGIPLIDLNVEGGDDVGTARDLVEAAVEYGFIYIRNTGNDIPVAAVENAFHLV